MEVLSRRIGAVLAVTGLLAAVALPAQAMPYSSLTIFGDSLSDTGNLFLATGGTQPPAGQPYAPGRFSNGPLWVDALAAGLGLPALVPSLAGGNNYAFAGARTATDPSPPGVLLQVGGLWAPSHPVADPNGLYVVVGGGNDLRDARAAGSTPASRQAAAVAAANNLAASIGLLASRGARHVLISNIGDLGATPEAVFLGLQANSTDVSLRFNAAVATLEGALEAAFPGLDVDMFDLYGLGQQIADDALNHGGATFGITNVVAPCNGFAGSPNVAATACGISLFSDALHPSARFHALIGGGAFALAVPLPATPLLAGMALLALVGVRRRHAG